MDVADHDKNLPLISIALCTYNGEKYLERQLRSILSQTYAKLEVVIVDDGSTDGTEDIILNYTETDPRIRFYKNETNLGFNKNFERAVGLATGQYIAISDQDDIWENHKIAALHANIGDNWVIFSNSDLVNEKEEPLGEQLVKQVDLDSISYKSFLYINHVTGHTSLFHRSFLTYYLPIPEQGYYDWWMGFVAAYHRKIVFLNEVLTLHRVHADSVVQQKILSNFDKKSREILNFNIVKEQLNNFRNYKYLEERDKAFLQEYEKAYTQSWDKFSFRLYWFYLKNFNAIHLHRKNKSLLSKINFVRKISGPVQG